MQELDNYVSCGITIHVGDMKINGILNKVSTWKKKEKGEIVGIYRQIDVSITSMNSVSGNEVLQIPDKKFQIMEDFSITIGVI
jgi:hypothetical protein